MIMNALFYEEVESEEEETEFVDIELESGLPSVKNGDFVFQTSSKAVLNHSLRALKVDRFKHVIHTFDFGSELKSLLGKNYSNSYTLAEVERYIKECFSLSNYIQNVSDITCEMNSSTLLITFTLETIYGNEEGEVYVQ